MCTLPNNKIQNCQIKKQLNLKTTLYNMTIKIGPEMADIWPK